MKFLDWIEDKLDKLEDKHVVLAFILRYFLKGFSVILLVFAVVMFFCLAPFWLIIMVLIFIGSFILGFMIEDMF